MTLKTTLVLGWIAFALDLIFVIGLFATRNVGDDAAGRGMATGFAMVLAPVLLLAGGILLWGTMSGARLGIIGGAIFTGLPFIVLAFKFASGQVENASRAVSQSRRGKFSDAQLTQVAKAVQAGDTAKVIALLHGRKFDFSQRDVFDHTLLGIAVEATTDMFAEPGHKQMVRVLLENGVPYAPDATEIGGDWFAAWAGSSGDFQIDLVEVALEHGANPNTNERYDDSALILSGNMTVAKLALLTKHGADVNVRSKRTDRPGWSTLMNAVYLGEWEWAMFFLQKGVAVDYRATDGKTVRDILKERATDDVAAGESAGPAYDAFVKALDAASAATR